MKNIESSKCEAGDEKDQSMSENTELLRNGLKDLLGLIENAEQYVDKVLVIINFLNVLNRKEKQIQIGK